MFHEPFGSGGGSTDTHSLDTLKPLWVYFFRSLDEVGIGIDTQALIEQHLAIRTLAPTDKEDEVVLGGELRDVRHAVGYRATDGVKALERSIGGDVFLDIFDDAMELVERL